MTQPLPINETGKALSLNNLDFDYLTLEHEFKHLLSLASILSGKEVVLLNLMDAYTQWTVAQYGIQVPSILREESICRYTIEGKNCFEVSDLSKDARFKESPYIKSELNFRYYLGIPLEISKGLNIGSLCFLSKDNEPLDITKIEQLKLIALEIIEKLKSLEEINTIKNKLAEAIKMQRKIIHDVRNPLAGIIGISDILIEPENQYDSKEVLNCLNLINISSKSMLEITDNIAIDLFEKENNEHSFNLETLSERISRLYLPLCKNREINFEITVDKSKAHIPFLKNGVLQIVRAIISSTLKSSKAGALVSVYLGISVQSDRIILQVQVKSNDPEEDIKSEYTAIDYIKAPLENLGGSFEFECNESEGLSYKINLPELS